MLLSGNGTSHLLVTLAAYTLGVPVAPVSVAYSLQTRAFDKLRAMAELVDPAVVFAADPDAFGPALRRPSARAAPCCRTTTCPALRPPPAPTEEVDAALRRRRAATPSRRCCSPPAPRARRRACSTRTACSPPTSSRCRQVWPFLADEPPVLLDWLPWSHTFGGNHNLNLVLAHGGTPAIDDGRPAPDLIDRTLRNLREALADDLLQRARRLRGAATATSRRDAAAAESVPRPAAARVLRGGRPAPAALGPARRARRPARLDDADDHVVGDDRDRAGRHHGALPDHALGLPGRAAARASSSRLVAATATAASCGSAARTSPPATTGRPDLADGGRSTSTASCCTGDAVALVDEADPGAGPGVPRPHRRGLQARVRHLRQRRHAAPGAALRRRRSRSPTPCCAASTATTSPRWPGRRRTSCARLGGDGRARRRACAPPAARRWAPRREAGSGASQRVERLLRARRAAVARTPARSPTRATSTSARSASDGPPTSPACSPSRARRRPSSAPPAEPARQPTRGPGAYRGASTDPGTIRPAVPTPPQRASSAARSRRSTGGGVLVGAPVLAREHPHHLELVAVRVGAVHALGGAVAGLAGVGAGRRSVCGPRRARRSCRAARPGGRARRCRGPAAARRRRRPNRPRSWWLPERGSRRNAAFARGSRATTCMPKTSV